MTDKAGLYASAVTRQELLDFHSLFQDMMITVVRYMVADWSEPDEDEKKEAIDHMFKLLDRTSASFRNLAGIEVHE